MEHSLNIETLANLPYTGWPQQIGEGIAEGLIAKLPWLADQQTEILRLERTCETLAALYDDARAGNAESGDDVMSRIHREFYPVSPA